jgi:LytS/YehU family sensor histidine kinase
VSAGAAFALGLAQAWRKEQEQRLATEVAFLRSQINPHFLFNTLNTLYALALAKSDKAPEAVLRLAAIMRYAVAQSGKLQVPLADEMAYLEGYLELQRLRMPPSMELTYDFPPEDSGGFVAPLLLIIPIENAFTHGIGQEAAGKIHIGIAYNAPKLDVIVQNTIPATKTVHESENMGTGLARMKGYLSSHYPARHKLDIQAEPDQYTLTLSLTIDG